MNVAAVGALYTGREDVIKLDTVHDTGFYRSWYQSKGDACPRGDDSPGFSDFVAAQLVNHCFGRGYLQVCGRRDSLLQPLEHPALIVVAPCVLPSSRSRICDWLDILLPALPYYLVKSTPEVCAPLFGLKTCLAVTVNDCGVCVSHITCGEEDPLTVSTLLFEATLVPFPCSLREEALQVTLDRMRSRLCQADVLQWLSDQLSLLAMRTHVHVVIVCGLLDADLLAQLRAAINSIESLSAAALLPTVDPVRMTAQGCRALLASPDVPNLFVAAQKRFNGERRRNLPLRAAPDLSVCPLRITSGAVHQYAPRARVFRWSDVQVAIPADALAKLPAHIPPYCGTLLSYALCSTRVPRLLVLHVDPMFLERDWIGSVFALLALRLGTATAPALLANCFPYNDTASAALKVFAPVVPASVVVCGNDVHGALAAYPRWSCALLRTSVSSWKREGTVRACGLA